MRVKNCIVNIEQCVMRDCIDVYPIKDVGLEQCLSI